MRPYQIHSKEVPCAAAGEPGDAGEGLYLEILSPFGTPVGTKIGNNPFGGLSVPQKKRSMR
jgi:hypothetical protein